MKVCRVADSDDSNRMIVRICKRLPHDLHGRGHLSISILIPPAVIPPTKLIAQIRSIPTIRLIDPFGRANMTPIDCRFWSMLRVANLSLVHPNRYRAIITSIPCIDGRDSTNTRLEANAMGNRKKARLTIVDQSMQRA